MIVGSATVLINVKTESGDTINALNATKKHIADMDDENRKVTKRIQQDWEKVQRTFSSVIKSTIALLFRLQFLVPTLGYIATAITGVVGGLTSMVAALARAGPAIAVLGTAGIGLATGLAAAVLAFSGIGDAVSALWSAQDKTTAGIKRTTQELYNAQTKIVDAERAVMRAQEQALDAQKALNNARRQAVMDLIDLNFQLEDNALSEERAILALEDARAGLQETAGLAGNSRERREAELDYREAVLNLRRVKTEGQDLAAQQRKAQREGVEGNENVVDAQRRVRDSQQDLIDSQKELSRAFMESTQASNAFNTSMQKLAGLTPEARQFALYIASLRPAIQGLQAAAGSALFPQLGSAISLLAQRALPTLTWALQQAGAALGDFAMRMAVAVTNTRTLVQFRQIIAANSAASRGFSQAVANVTQAVIALSAAAGPLLVIFSQWVERITASWNASVQLRSRTGELSAEMYRAGAVLAQVGRILRNVWEYFKAVIGAGQAAGQSLLDTFEIFTRRGAAAAQTAERQAELAQRYQAFAQVLKDVANIVRQLIGMFAELAIQPGMREASQIIQTQLVPALSQIFIAGADLAPVIAEIVVHLAEMFSIMQETGIMRAFFDSINGILNVLQAILSLPMVPELVGVAIAMLAAVRILRSFVAVFAFLTKGSGIISTITASVIGLIEAGGGLRVFFTGLAGVIRAAITPAQMLFAQLSTLIGLFIAFIAENDLGEAWNALWHGIVNTVELAVNAMKAILQGFANFTINPIISLLNRIPGVNVGRVQFASGGVVPGYAPGSDTVPAMLSPGEGVLRPETVRALGPSTVNMLNSMGSAASLPGGDPQLSTAITSLVTYLRGQSSASGTYILNVTSDRPLDVLLTEFRRLEGAR